MRKYKPRDGWEMQAFGFALKPTREQQQKINRFFGARRFAHNWAVTQIKAQLFVYRWLKISMPAPSFYGMRDRWNEQKHTVAVNTETGEVWWRDISKEVFNDGIRSAVDSCWRWQKSRAGKIAGQRVGFPRYHKRGKRRDSFTITRANPARQLVGRGQVYIPRIGWVRTHESTRKLARLIEQDRGEALAVTVCRQGQRLYVKVRVAVERPQHKQSRVETPMRVGVDIGERVLAVIANADGEILERVENPKPLTNALTEVRLLNRKLGRQKHGSNGWHETKTKLNELHDHIACVRRDAIHKLTTHLVNTYNEVVIEDLNSAGMRKGGAKHLKDAAFGEFKRQMLYKAAWYGCNVILADRFFPSSKTCSACGEIGNPNSKQRWTCKECGVEHDRDDNAAINLARYEPAEEPEEEVINRRVAPVQAPAVRSGGINDSVDRNGVPKTGITSAVVPPCKHNASKEAA